MQGQEGDTGVGGGISETCRWENSQDLMGRRGVRNDTRSTESPVGRVVELPWDR